MRSIWTILLVILVATNALRVRTNNRLAHFHARRSKLPVVYAPKVNAIEPNPEAPLHRDIPKQIMSVAIPALAACVVEPALTMVDMYFVGTQLDATLATAGLAALSITGSVFNVVAALTYPLCSGTTAIIARTSSVSKATDTENVSNNSKRGDHSGVLLNGLVLAGGVGMLLAVLLSAFSRPVISRFVSLEGAVSDLAVQYTRIRSLSLPFTLLSYVIVGFCMAVQDATTPVVSIVASCVVNILGDYILVRRLPPGGVIGAAWATTLATVVSTSLTLWRLWTVHMSDNTQASWMDQWKARLAQLNASTMSRFFRTSLVLLVGMLANTLTYSAGAKISSYVRSSTVQPTIQPALSAAVAGASIVAAMSSATQNIAAHQISMQLWWFMSYFSSPFALAAEAILPKGIIAGDDARVKKTITTIMQFAMAVATICTAVVAGLLYLKPALFTTDRAVQRLVASILPLVVSSHCMICLTTVLDGVYIGTNRVRDYITVSVLSTAAAWAYYARVAIPRGLGVRGTWNGLFIFCAVRALFHAVKVEKGDLYRYAIGGLDYNAEEGKV